VHFKTVSAVVLSLAVSGCSAEQRTPTNCALAGGAALGAIGAIATVVAAQELTPTTYDGQTIDSLPFPAEQRRNHEVEDWQIYGGLGVGLAGTLIGALLGYYLCSGDKQAASQEALKPPATKTLVQAAAPASLP
jgi:hypothetical protein